MKQAQNQWLKQILESVGEVDCQKAIEKLIREFRSPEQSLDSLSKHLGIETIDRKPLPFEGGVFEIEGNRRIILNSLAAQVRQTFTLAHEVGHLILERKFEAAVSCADDEELERACDMLAAELLMPAVRTRAFAEDLGKQSPEKLSRVANHFSVSLQTAAQRLHDLGLWKMGIGMWICGSTSKQLWYVGKKPWKKACPSFSAFQLAIESNVPVCTSERMPVGPGSDTELVALKAHHIGKNYVVAVVATTEK